MSAPLENAVRIEIEMPVHIPTPDGKAVAETVMVKVPALKDPATGEVYLTGEALEIMDKKKARLMGLLLPSEVKELRARLGLTQLKLSGLLGIGEKTCTRWETGRERPSQSLNLMLVALWEGRLNVTTLQALRQPTFSWYERISGIGSYGSEHKPYMIKTTENPKEPVTHGTISLAA